MSVIKYTESIIFSLCTNEFSPDRKISPLDRTTSFSKLGKFLEDIVVHMAGFVIKSLSKKLVFIALKS